MPAVKISSKMAIKLKWIPKKATRFWSAYSIGVSVTLKILSLGSAGY